MSHTKALRSLIKLKDPDSELDADDVKNISDAMKDLMALKSSVRGAEKRMREAEAKVEKIREVMRSAFEAGAVPESLANYLDQIAAHDGNLLDEIYVDRGHGFYSGAKMVPGG